jgi:ABC-type Fe3+/spermidine/putrescine transport system ATPase subunit
MYLTFDGVTKRYGQTIAVADITFGIEQGEFVSLLGPSGCGKTTTLMLLAGFETPDAGSITLAGVNLASCPPERRGVGVVFQHYALFPHMTVANNVAFGLTYGAGKKLARREVAARVAELLALVDLAELAQRKPAELSAGQQQRVAIARSLAPRPRVLCLDEPLSALDALLREKLRLEIRRLQQSLGLTVLYVTHDQEEALAISDQVVVMAEGRIKQIGTPQQIYDRPVDRFVAGFIGKGALLEVNVVRVTAQLEVDVPGVGIYPVPVRAWCGPTPPAPGAAVLVIRPEQATVQPGGESNLRGALAVPGRLAAVEYLGGSLRLHVQATGGELTAMASPGELSAWQARVGEPVVLSVPTEDMRLVPAG